MIDRDKIKLTTMTLETPNGKYSVGMVDEHMVLTDLIDDIIRPVLIAAGYPIEQVNKYLPDDVP